MYGPLTPGVTIPVQVVVSVRSKYENLRQILETTVNLYRRNQEETAFSFRLASQGELVDGSVSTLRRSMITGGWK